MSRPALRVSKHTYRALLLVYPKEFRREYGPRMEQTFMDLCREKLRRGGRRGLARLWVHAMADLVASASVERRSGIGLTNNEEVTLRDGRLAWIGSVLLLAPLYFVAASLLKYGLGVGLLFNPLESFLSVSARRDAFNLVSPVVFLGGLSLALALNAPAVLRLSFFGREDGVVVCAVRLKMGSWNIAVTIVSALLLIVLVGYVFLENFTYLGLTQEPSERWAS